MRVKSSNHNRNCLAAWIVATIVLPQTSSAQLGWWKTLQPMTSRAALTECLESLDVESPDVIWTLYESMALTIIQKAATFETAMKQSKGYDGFTNWQRTKQWNDTRLGLQLQFEDDVALSLDETQREIWTSFTRDLRRQRVLIEMGSTDPELVLLDLLEVLDTLDLNAPERDDLKDTCKMYEEIIDLLLVAWEQQFGEIYSELFRLQPLIKAKDKKAKEAYNLQKDQLSKLSFDVKELNNSIETEMASFMEPDNKKKFLKIVTVRDFPELFTQSPSDLAVKRLESFDELTDEQRGVIHLLYNDYNMQRSALRQQMISALRQFRSQKHLDRLNAKFRELKQNGEDVQAYYAEYLAKEYPNNKLRRMRSLERQTCQKMRNVFSVEQFNKLPAEVRLYLSLWKKK